MEEDDEVNQQKSKLEDKHCDKRREEETEMDCPSHHPPPPPDELFDIDTTVDPSYVISLIRKLLPTDSGSGESDQSTEVRHAHHMYANNVVQEGVVPRSGEGFVDASKGDPESMDIGDNHGKESTSEEKDKASSSVEAEAWEEHGCVLWDLAANETHAELMVQNLILQVLHANLLLVSTSDRIREICLGIIGNLACHEALLKHIESTSGLVNTLVGQLILTTGLYGAAGSTLWAECLQSDDILRRILWIAENTLNPHLIEKSVGLLLAILEEQSEVGKLLIPPLMTLGLTNLLINLLSFEMSKLIKERVPERYPVLEMILRAIEALSASDSHSKEICSSKELFHLACDLMKLQDKTEVAACCVTAGVLIANIVSETVSFIPEVSQDFSFLEGLFSTLPFASDDVEARRAIWSIIARLLARVNESEIDTSCLRQYILVLLSKSDVIEDDLLDIQLEEESLNSFPSQGKSSARTIAIQKIESMLNNWNIRKETLQEEENIYGDCSVNTDDVKRLYDCCRRYISKSTEGS
ncbi:ARM repeat superfamily protein [Hirschfeldia incana]|nr:ARM repeat superfamily protein [Hirschfeldia incana]